MGRARVRVRCRLTGGTVYVVVSLACVMLGSVPGAVVSGQVASTVPGSSGVFLQCRIQTSWKMYVCKRIQHEFISRIRPRQNYGGLHLFALLHLLPMSYSTVTLLARFLGWSTLHLRMSAM